MRFKVAQVGLGKRGKIHLKGILDNKDYFEIVGLCDIDKLKMEEAASLFNVQAPLYTDVEKMIQETKPDVFIFVTLPETRINMVDIAVKYEIKAMSFEKPMATNIRDAKYVTEQCKKNNIKAIISHQQKYLKQMQIIKGIINREELGKIEKIHVETQPWLSQLGTHYIDYAMWINGGKSRVKSVVGHAHGVCKLTDSHPSPDYILGEALLEDGVRIYLECGYFSERHKYVPKLGYDNRITVYGTHGYAWAETDGRYGAFTKVTHGKVVEEIFDEWDIQDKIIQTPYYTDFADWLENDNKVHPCNIDISYHGFEALEGICLSALNHTRIDLPLTDIYYEPVLKRMAREFPSVITTQGHL